MKEKVLSLSEARRKDKFISPKQDSKLNKEQQDFWVKKETEVVKVDRNNHIVVTRLFAHED